MNKDQLPSISSRSVTFVHKIPIVKTQIFWEGLKKGDIFATKCKSCSKLYFPPQLDCALCLASDVEWIKLSKTVTLETFTQIKIRPQGFTGYDPYILAIVKTDEGAKVMGWLENIKLEEVSVGMNLEMGSKILEEKIFVIVFKPKQE